MKTKLKYILPSLVIILLTILLVIYLINLSKLPSKTNVANTLNSYIANIYNENASENEYYFASSYISQIKKHGSNLYVYALIASDAYKYHTSLENTDNYADLYRFTVSYENKEIKILDYETRGDGDAFLKDQKRLFPRFIYTKLHFAEINGTLTKLHQATKTQAENFYSLKNN